MERLLEKLKPNSMDNMVPASTAGKAITTGAVIFGARWLLKKYTDYRESARLGQMRKKAQGERDQSIKTVTQAIRNDKDALADKDVITKIPPLEIVAKIKNGELTSLRVLRAFQAKALECQEKTNAICYFFDQAEEWAKKCDADPKKEGRLFGLPISVKDHYTLEGYETIFGCSRNIGQVAEETCVFLKCILREGAVPFARTNVPQVMLSIESSNPVYGATGNSYDPTRGSGGSSSGEGALIGYGASPLGLGSDIGGSIRQPSNFCGCYGFKPTTYRVSVKDSPRFGRGQTAVFATFGPLAADVDTLVECCQILWDDPQMFEADIKIPPLTFNHRLFETKRPLRIGFYYDLPEAVGITPAVRRAVDMAKGALEAQGHTVVPWTPPSGKRAIELFFTVLYAHEGNPFVGLIKNDELDDSIAVAVGLLRKPRWYKQLMSFIKGFYDPTQAFFLKAGAGQSAEEYFDTYEIIQNLRDEVNDSWTSAGLDACICPPMPFPAMPLKRTGSVQTETLYLAGFVYTMLYNVLNLPAGIVPVTKVTAQDVKHMEGYPKRNAIEKSIHFGMTGAEGLPLSCQIVGKSFRDEMVLRVMKEVEEGLKKA